MKKNKKGLTILEIIITTLVFSIIFVAILTTLATARTSWNSAGSQLQVHQEARKALRVIMKELRQAKLSGISEVPADNSNYSSITFQIPSSISDAGVVWTSVIRYTLGGLNNSQLIRTQNSNQKILANNISTFSLSRSSVEPDLINISITSQKNTFAGFTSNQSSITLNSEVKVRNP